MSRRVTIIAGVGTFFVLAWFVMGSTFFSSSICHHCGASQSASRWFIPGTEICYFHPASVHPTPVSKVLESTGMVGAHDHDWWLVHGSGNGIHCAIGHGGRLRAGVNSENVASLLAAAHRFGETAFRDKMVEALLNPKTSLTVYYLGNRVTEECVKDEKSFRAWMEEESGYFFEDLAMAEAE
ncbi:MAG: hypothetical protein ACAH88_11910 [Roseimicrobium sp.]